jgi:hypothetical protein
MLTQWLMNRGGVVLTTQSVRGRTMPSSAEIWRRRTGIRRSACCSRLIPRINAAVLMSLLILLTGTSANATGNDKQMRQMTNEQQDKLLRYTNLGLRWVKGDTSFDDVKKELGAPDLQTDQQGTIDYIFFPEKVMEVRFTYYRKGRKDDGYPEIGDFRISVFDDVVTDIDCKIFDNLGFHRVTFGEKIDALRVEPRKFFIPVGAADVSHAEPLNSISFMYRILSGDDLPYDIYVAFNYHADIKESGPWDLSRVNKAVNLRIVSAARLPLTDDELAARAAVRR